MKSSQSFRYMNKLLYNRFLLYAILFISLINMTVYSLMGDVTTPLIFVLIGVITAYFNKNMLVILFISLVFSNIANLVINSNSFKPLVLNEGFENDENGEDNKKNGEKNGEKSGEKSGDKSGGDGEKKDNSKKDENAKNKKKTPSKNEMDEQNKNMKEAQENYENLYALQKNIEKSIETLTTDLGNAEKIIEKLENKFNKNK